MGCTSLGQVVAWKITAQGESDVKCVEPEIKQGISSKALRSIQHHQSNKTIFLAGDEGLWAISRKDLLSTKLDNIQKLLDEPIQQIQAHENHLYILNQNNNTVLQMSITTLQTLAKFPPPIRGVSATTFQVINTGNMKNQVLLLVGTNHSKVWVWDTQTQKQQESLDLSVLLEKKSSSSSSSSMRHKNNMAHLAVTSMVCHNNHWWIVGGKITDTTSGSTGGFLSTWHGPTRSLSCSRYPTRESIQRLVMTESGLLYAATNQVIVNVWDSPHQIEDRDKGDHVGTHRIWVSPPSGKALAPATKNITSNHSSSTRVAIAGVGHKVDILSNHCRLFSVEM